MEARIPRSVAGAAPACYDRSTADARNVVWVEVEAGKVHGGHCVDGSGWVVGEVARLHEVGVVVLESNVVRYASLDEIAVDRGALLVRLFFFAVSLVLVDERRHE